MTLDGPGTSGVGYGSLSSSSPLARTPAFQPQQQQQQLPQQQGGSGIAVPPFGTSGHTPSTYISLSEDSDCFLTMEEVYRSLFGREKAGPDTPHADEWMDVRGRHRWNGLVPPIGSRKPLDTYLRAELVKYGELAQATYDAFEKRPHSLFFSQPYFKFNELLPSVTSNSWSNLSYPGGWSYTIENKDDYLSASSGLYDRDMLGKVDAAHSSHAPKDTWIGFIAVGNAQTPISGETEARSSGPKDIVVVFRGTVMPSEWFWDLSAAQKNPSKKLLHNLSVPDDNDTLKRLKKVRMHAGFLSMYSTGHDEFKRQQDSKGGWRCWWPSRRKSEATGPKDESIDESTALRDVVRRRLRALVDKHDVRSITFVGHSLGAALASVAALDIAVMRKLDPVFQGEKWDKISFAAYTFAGPRVGNRHFRNLLKDLDMPVLNVVNFGDIVPCLPAGLQCLSTGLADPRKGKLRFIWDVIRNLPGNLILIDHGVKALRCPPLYWRQCVWFNKWMPALWSYVNAGEFLFVNSNADRSRPYIDRHKLPGATRELALEPPEPPCSSCSSSASTHVSKPSRTMRDTYWLLFKVSNIGLRHNMEGYLFMVSTQRTGQEHKPFWRDPALLNKGSDLLEESLAEELKIPAVWWSPVPNAALVARAKDGRRLWGVLVPEDSPDPDAALAIQLIKYHMQEFGIHSLTA